MTGFEKRIIIESSEIIARELKKTREQKKLSLAEVSATLKINVKYLEALERGDFEALPIGIYKINFLKEYVIFLGLPLDEFVDLFENSQNGKDNLMEEDLFVRKAGNARFSLTIPKVLRSLLLLSSSAVCLIYLAYSLNAIIAAPVLNIESPSLDTVTKEKEIVVRGSTVPEAQVMINDELVLASSDGVFEKKVNLKSGLNTIVISAQKKYSRTNEMIKKVMVSGS
jgi:cytoskeletal protein RodZ